MARKKQNGISKSTARRRRTRKFDKHDNATALATAMEWLIGTSDMFVGCAFHGNINWKPMQIIFQALCWAFQESPNVTDAFEHSRRFCESVGKDSIALTYPRFINALVRYSCLANRLRSRIHRLAKNIAGKYWEDDGWVPFAFDGSRISTPRTKLRER
jgi:hypothetical protein